tara:strand:+ start:309 stop:482 length:174 start_codon:yes stop_codon:yes gene_type:complete
MHTQTINLQEQQQMQDGREERRGERMRMGTEVFVCVDRLGWSGKIVEVSFRARRTVG